MEKFLVRLLNHLSRMRHLTEEGNGIYGCTISFDCIIFFMLLKIFQFLFIFFDERQLFVFSWFTFFLWLLKKIQEAQEKRKSLINIFSIWISELAIYFSLVTFEFSSGVTRSLFWTLRRFIDQKAVQIPLEL